jgi:hypothetical protein
MASLNGTVDPLQLQMTYPRIAWDTPCMQANHTSDVTSQWLECSTNHGWRHNPKITPTTPGLQRRGAFAPPPQQINPEGTEPSTLQDHPVATRQAARRAQTTLQ